MYKPAHPNYLYKRFYSTQVANQVYTRYHRFLYLSSTNTFRIACTTILFLLDMLVRLVLFPYHTLNKQVPPLCYPYPSLIPRNYLTSILLPTKKNFVQKLSPMPNALAEPANLSIAPPHTSRAQDFDRFHINEEEIVPPRKCARNSDVLVRPAQINYNTPARLDLLCSARLVLQGV